MKQQSYLPLQKIKYKQDSHSYIVVHDQIYITHINPYQATPACKIMEFTKMTYVNVTSYKNYNLNQLDAYIIHAVSVTKYQKYQNYPSI